jgi:hypothetical protein
MLPLPEFDRMSQQGLDVSLWSDIFPAVGSVLFCAKFEYPNHRDQRKPRQQ